MNRGHISEDMYCRITFLEQNTFWETDSHSLVKKFPAFYGTRRYITVFIRICHWSLSWTRWIQSTNFHPVSQRSILILCSHLLPRLPTGLLGFPIKILYALLIFPLRATCPTHLIFPYLITLIIFGEAYKLWNCPILILLQPSATSSLLGQSTLCFSVIKWLLQIKSNWPMFIPKKRWKELWMLELVVYIVFLVMVRQLQ